MVGNGFTILIQICRLSLMSLGPRRVLEECWVLLLWVATSKIIEICGFLDTECILRVSEGEYGLFYWRVRKMNLCLLVVCWTSWSSWRGQPMRYKGKIISWINPCSLSSCPLFKEDNSFSWSLFQMLKWYFPKS